MIAPGAVLVGAVAVEGTDVVVRVFVGVDAGAEAAGPVTVWVIAGGAGPESPASFTSAAASAASASSATSATATTGARQFGVAARRVRAAAPQRRHHSCPGARGEPHNGHSSPLAAVPAGCGAGAEADDPAGVAALTAPVRAG